jgi:hypothetical protein
VSISLFPYNTCSYPFKLSCVVLDKEKRVIAVLVGGSNKSRDSNCPNGMQWKALFQQLSTEVEAEHSSHTKSFIIPNDEPQPYCSNYAVVTFGLSYGGG